MTTEDKFNYGSSSSQTHVGLTTKLLYQILNLKELWLGIEKTTFYLCLKQYCGIKSIYQQKKGTT